MIGNVCGFEIMTWGVGEGEIGEGPLKAITMLPTLHCCERTNFGAVLMLNSKSIN